jgi:hypothetical protein
MIRALPDGMYESCGQTRRHPQSNIVVGSGALHRVSVASADELRPLELPAG